MRLPQQHLAQHLSKELRPLYVLMGDEPLAQRESLDAIRAKTRQEGFDDRTSLTVERNFNWQQVIAFGQSLSLFSSRRILELNIPSGKPGTDGSKALQAMAENPMADTVVIIILPKLDRDGKNSAWYSALESAGVSLALLDVPAEQLPRWIAERLAIQGQETDAETLALFKKTGAYLVPTMIAPEAAVTQARAGARPPNVLAKAEEAAKVAYENHILQYKSGVKIAFGTDTGVSAHGQNATEFKMMVDAGMSPANAIKSATVDAADLLGRSASLGTLEPGKDADLVAVARSPLTDVTELERPTFVMRRGVVHKLAGQRQAFPPL